jgi:hypothetical protein
MEDPDGTCRGTCDGDCLGDCSLSIGGPCDGLCTGACYVDTPEECGDPTVGAAGPCTFSIASTTPPDSCGDYAYDIGNYNTYYVQCSDGRCQCCRTGQVDSAQGAAQVCFPIEPTPATACASLDTLRQVLVDECMQNSPCGAGCPGTATPRGTCDETEILECAYMTAPSYCMCMGGMYVCQ